MFANDVMIFCKAHTPTLQITMAILEKFHQIAGLLANQAKSQLVYRGCDSTLQEKCLEITGYQEGALPM